MPGSTESPGRTDLCVGAAGVADGAGAPSSGWAGLPTITTFGDGHTRNRKLSEVTHTRPATGSAPRRHRVVQRLTVLLVMLASLVVFVPASPASAYSGTPGAA